MGAADQAADQATVPPTDLATVPTTDQAMDKLLEVLPPNHALMAASSDATKELSSATTTHLCTATVPPTAMTAPTANPASPASPASPATASPAMMADTSTTSTPMEKDSTVMDHPLALEEALEDTDTEELATAEPEEETVTTSTPMATSTTSTTTAESTPTADLPLTGWPR